MLRYSLILLLLTAFAGGAIARPSDNPPAKGSDKLYEVRIYYPMPGKYAEIVDRFRQYTTKLFAKHGMENVGYWTPTDTARHELIYMLAYPNRAARDTSWKHFGADPEWQAVVAKTQANGKLVDHVDQIFMTEADFSPAVSPVVAQPVVGTPAPIPGRANVARPGAARAEPPMSRTFELRTYTAAPGKLPDLLTRFRDHTVGLLNTHGMTNIGYWLTEKADATGQAQLLYIVAHPTEAAGKQHWGEFGSDDAWKTVKTASEKNGPLTQKIDAVYLTPTDYSPMK